MSGVAYLVSDYNAPSHTFVRREVAALRRRGMAVQLFSVRNSCEGEEPVENLVGRPLAAYLQALLWALATRPRSFLSGWAMSWRHRPPGMTALLWSQFHFIEAVMLMRLLHRGGCERLHNHFANSGATVGLIAARMLGIPWSLTLHGISETDYPAGVMLPEKIEQASFVACANYFMRSQGMRTVDSAHWAKMQIVRCGIDLKALPPTKDGTSNVPKLVCVGRLSPEKGYFGLLEALAALDKDGLHFELTIVGDGPAGDSIRSRTRALGLEDKVEFAGMLPEADTLRQIAQADIFVLPSLMEGLPVVLIEALALGKPAVASHIAGIPELVVDGENGLLFTPSDWTDLESKLRRLVSDDDLRKRLSLAGPQAVKAGFEIDQAAEVMERLFATYH